ncbi:GTP pyrophosphokinase [Lysinibacillus sp. NPDC048646]|uniref:GTP pyrophosphokinase n=1 Tax=Lysinibacillus sp. NPDC048646 TaxID=3390574 RepID=UPI003D090F39
MSTFVVSKNKESLESWYLGERSRFDSLGNKIVSILTEIIETEEIQIHSISSRSKEVKSFLNKAMKEKYKNPLEEIHDLAGIRIITFVRSDVEKISNIIKRTFSIDNENSIDKGAELGIDKVGYRSVHFVAEMTEDRLRLADYQRYTGMKFEIQVRTIMEHAWADLSHDRNYKFNGVLPNEKDIKRRFSLIAATIELLDRQFDELANEIDSYDEEVKKSLADGLKLIEVDSTTLSNYLKIEFSDKIANGTISPNFNGQDKRVIEELKLFGICTISELDEIIIDKIGEEQNFTGMIRHFMMANNPMKYFKEVWTKESWTVFEEDSLKLILGENPDLANALIEYGHDIEVELEDENGDYLPVEEYLRQ